MKIDKILTIKILFITSLITANLVTGKILNIFGLIVPGAAICYAFTFLATDLISELRGKKESQELVVIGFIASSFAAALVYLTQQLPAPDFATERAEAYNILLGINLRITIASMVGYLTSQMVDVYVFHKLKEKTKGKYKWLRNNASTLTSQLVDTSIFITIGFYGIVPNIWIMIVSQYLLKLIIALIDTPFFYLLTRKTNIK